MREMCCENARIHDYMQVAITTQECTQQIIPGAWESKVGIFWADLAFKSCMEGSEWWCMYGRIQVSNVGPLVWSNIQSKMLGTTPPSTPHILAVSTVHQCRMSMQRVKCSGCT